MKEFFLQTDIQSIDEMDPPSLGWCGIGVYRLQNMFEGVDRVEFKRAGGVIYSYMGQNDNGSQHIIARISEGPYTGTVIDLCRLPGDRVFSSIEEYIRQSGIVFEKFHIGDIPASRLVET